jgi:beta-glucosidase
MQRTSHLAVTALAGMLTVSVAPLPARAAEAAAGTALYRDPAAPLEQRVDDLLARLTPRERIALLAGGAAFATTAVARLGIPSINVTDGPNGVRSNDDRPATVFPTGSALAATWNPSVLQAVGEAIGREALAMNARVLLGPNVNIQRSPLAGRNFESYSEDPYLAGTMGTAFVRGVQSQGVGTSVKHFVGNEQELERMRSSSNIDERTLREIYLLPFEMIVKAAKPWTIMVSYNRLNGTYMSENERLIRSILEGEWGFDGVVMSDWGAVHSTVAAANAGLGLEMPGPPRYFGPLLEQAVSNWQVSEGAVDDAARRMVRALMRVGALDGRPASGELTSARNREVALNAAREAIALLKNERQVLPLEKSRLRTVAVIGPNADVPLYEGGGSASVIPSRIMTPLMSIRALLGDGVRVLYAQGVDNDRVPPPADARLFSPTRARTQSGLAFSYYGSSTPAGRPVRSGVDTYFDKTMFASDLAQMAARWEGFFWAPKDGVYEFSLSQIGNATLYIDDKKVLGDGIGVALPAQIDFGGALRLAQVDLKSGAPHTIRVDYSSPPIAFHSMHLGMRLPPDNIEAAVQVARSADAAIVFVGSSRSSETEGRDRADMELAGRQNELVQAVVAANPRTVVVLNNGAPLALPWVDTVPAIVEGWFAGEEGANALAQVLFGTINPSGKLPFTFPKRLQDNPAYLYYSGGRDASYGEGVFVGYRYYDKRKLEPLFPFGHGLSYTQFEYSHLRVPAAVDVGQPVAISVDVKNVGERAGAETVQLYVADDATTQVVRPEKELKGFQKISLSPGETKTVRFTLMARDLSYYDVHRKDWTSTPGTHRVLVGSSSRDIRQQQPFQWTAPQAVPGAAERVSRAE